MVSAGGCSLHPGYSYVKTVNFDEDIAVPFCVIDVPDGIIAVITVIRGCPVVERSTCGSNDVLVDIVGGIAVIVGAGVIVEVVVAAEVCSAAGFSDGGPESVAGSGIIVETVLMVGLKSGFVAKNKDVWIAVGC